MSQHAKDYITHGLTKDQIKGGMVMIYRLSSVFFIFWAVGALAIFRLGDGFAYASDAKVVEQNVLAGRKDFLQARAFDLQVAKCASETPRIFTVQLQQIQSDYRDLTGEYIALPTCEELKN